MHHVVSFDFEFGEDPEPANYYFIEISGLLKRLGYAPTTELSPYRSYIYHRKLIPEEDTSYTVYLKWKGVKREDGYDGDYPRYKTIYQLGVLAAVHVTPKDKKTPDPALITAAHEAVLTTIEEEITQFDAMLSECKIQRV